MVSSKPRRTSLSSPFSVSSRRSGATDQTDTQQKNTRPSQRSNNRDEQMCAQKQTLRSGCHSDACSAGGSKRLCLDGNRMNPGDVWKERKSMGVEASRASTKTSRGRWWGGGDAAYRYAESQAPGAEPSKGNMLDMIESALGIQGDTFTHAASMDTCPLAEGTETLTGTRP